jgi:hypothetical protein
MTYKHNETMSTMINQSDSGYKSFNMSDIFTRQNNNLKERLCSSVEYFKSPFQ